MNTFQNYVFVWTLGLLLLALTITAIVLKTSKTSSTYPPTIDNCPDYWYNSYYDMDASAEVGSCKNTEFGCCPDNRTPKTDDSGSTCPLAKCYNVKKLGIQSDTCGTEMDFSKYSTCQKQTWAKSCDMTWDGITNMPSAC